MGFLILYLVGFDTDLDGVVDDTLNGDENLHRPEISKRSTFVCLVDLKMARSPV